MLRRFSGIPIFLLAASVAVMPAIAQKIDLGKMLVEAVGETGTEEKTRLDSTDFQFAMSVSENTGFLDAGQKGEGTASLMYLMREESAKTPSERARDTLNMAIRYYKLRFYRLSEMNFNQARSMLERDGLTGEVNYARCISGLGLLALIQGRTGDADRLLTAALDLSKARLGDVSVAVAANLNNRAKLDQLLGRYNEAERGFGEALVVLEKSVGLQSIQAATVTNNLALLNLSVGRKEQAIVLMKKAALAAQLAIDRGVKGKKSFENRMFQSNLALAYQTNGNLAEAEKTFLEIKSVFEKRGQNNNPEYANVLNQVALLYMQMGKDAQAESLLRSAGDVYKKKFSEQSPAYARILHDLATLFRRTGRLTEAESAGAKALSIRQRVLGESHPDYARSLEHLGLIRWQAGNKAGAYVNLRAAADLNLKFIQDYFRPMSEAEKTRYWETLQPTFQRFYAFAIDYASQDKQVLQDVFRYQIATKALLLQSTTKTRRIIMSSGDRQLSDDYTHWVALKEQLARLYALSREELRDQKIDLPTIESEANGLERKLSARSSAFSEAFQGAYPSFSQLCSSLTDQEVLLEVVRVQGYEKDFTDEVNYLLLTARRGDQGPGMAVLRNGKLLETRYARYYKNAVLQRQPDVYSWEKFWAPADSLIKGTKTVFLSPDGVYNQINVNTLRSPEGVYVLNKTEVVVIGNPRDVLTVKSGAAISSGKQAFLLGFPEYRGVAEPLPGTKSELEGVQKVLRTAGYTLMVKQQTEASEKNIKQVKSPTIMHIATHGYFLADTEIGSGNLLGVNAENARSNPLLRAGLILASPAGQRRDATRFDYNISDDGILTAYEAMNLDLDGTSLIVLSACETGLGEVRAGEGVYGLQRSFLVAGARALIMSLWKVDDAATQELMTVFYSEMVKSTNRLEAFRTAQKQLRSKYPDPYFWGAFVMMGM